MDFKYFKDLYQMPTYKHFGGRPKLENLFTYVIDAENIKKVHCKMKLHTLKTE